MQKDYLVRCHDCGAEYTPKAREPPSQCYECRSLNIDADLLGPSNPAES